MRAENRKYEVIKSSKQNSSLDQSLLEDQQNTRTSYTVYISYNIIAITVYMYECTQFIYLIIK